MLRCSGMGSVAARHHAGTRDVVQLRMRVLMHRFLGCCVAMHRQACWNHPGKARDVLQRV